MCIEDLIAPAICAELLDPLASLGSLLIPQLHNTARRISALEDTLARLSDADSSVKVRVLLRRQPGSDSLEERDQIIGIGDASSTQTLTSIEQLTVGGVEEVSQSCSQLLLHRLAEDRSKQRLDEPGDPAEAALAQVVVQLVDVYTDGLQRQDLLQTLLADLDINVDVDTTIVESEGCDAFVHHPQDSTMSAEPEANLISAGGESINLDGHETSRLGSHTEPGFLELQIVVGLDLEAVGKERGMVDSVARLDDQVLQKQIDIGSADLQSWDRDILNSRDKEGNKHVDGVLQQLRVCESVGWRENGGEFEGRLDHVVDILVFEDTHERGLNLSEKGVNVIAEAALCANLLALFAELLELFLCVLEEVGVCEKLLQTVANVLHQVFKLGVVLLVAHNLLDQLFALLPFFNIAEALDE